ncbi:MAG: YggT family protein [Pseudomonadota bacterium]
MTILAYLIIALSKVIGLIINIYTFIVIIAALISWVSPDPHNPIVKLVYGLTWPVFARIRRFLPEPLRRLPIDISPIIVLILLVLIDTIVVGMLYNYGTRMMH